MGEGETRLRDVMCLRREQKWNSRVQVIGRLFFLSKEKILLTISFPKVEGVSFPSLKVF